MPNLSKHSDRAQDGSAVASVARIHTHLRADILTGMLKPGNKIRIEDLAARYKISHIPIREALSGLVTEGLVNREERRGFFVTAFTIDMLEELVRTRCWLEERALTESIANRTVEWEEQLVLALHWLTRTERYSDAGRTVLNQEWESRHKHFHHVLISACRSSLLLRYCQEIRDRVDSYRFITESDDPHPLEPRPEDEHAAIADAALAGDTATAVSLLIAHYQRTFETIRPRLDAAT